MKNTILTGIIVIAIIGMALIGCDGDDKPADNPPVPYGTLPNGVGIYKGDASITDAEMATAVQAAVAGYNASLNAGKNPNGNYTKLVILGHGTTYTWDGNVLGVNVDADYGFFKNIFEKAADGSLPKL